MPVEKEILNNRLAYHEYHILDKFEAGAVLVGTEVKSIQAGDYTTSKLIDAKTAVWVINPKERGVMSAVATWAFAGKTEADAYIKQNGGKLATWDEAQAAACEEQAESAKSDTPGCNCCNKKKK